MTDEVDANQERSRRLYEEVFGQGNYAVADDLMAADTVNHGPGSPPVLGTDGIKRQAALLRTAIPDLRATLNDQFGQGDRVVSRWTGSGTHSGPLTLPAGTVEGSGQSISFDERSRSDSHTSGHSGWGRRPARGTPQAAGIGPACLPGVMQPPERKSDIQPPTRRASRLHGQCPRRSFDNGGQIIAAGLAVERAGAIGQ